MRNTQRSQTFVIAALVCWVAFACRESTAESTARKPVIGLPCEGCNAVFDGLPREVDWSATLAPETEPGERLVLEGTVFDIDGAPAAEIIVYAYQTDARGVYPPDNSRLTAAGRRHGRLHAWARTDPSGRYRFETIRPAGYPGARIAQHIHLHVIEPGCCTYYIDDVHFEDDERLDAEDLERLLSGRGGSGLVRAEVGEDGDWYARRDIRLGENVPGHPRTRRGEGSNASR